MAKKIKRHCQCGDPGCPVHPGTSHCPNAARTKVYRSDMEDYGGTWMCLACADDALDSGVFYTRNPRSKSTSLIPRSWKKAQIRRLPDGRVQVKIPNPAGRYMPGPVRRGLRSAARRFTSGKTQAALLRFAAVKRNAKKRRR